MNFGEDVLCSGHLITCQVVDMAAADIEHLETAREGLAASNYRLVKLICKIFKLS